MILELRQKSQITIPKEITKQLSLNIGDQLEIFVKDGEIHLVPVVVYPKAYIEELETIAKNSKNKIENGEQKVFEDVESLIDMLKTK